jgi:Ca2+-binding EF-hand superfamily protein
MGVPQSLAVDHAGRPMPPLLGADEAALLEASTHYTDAEVRHLYAQFAADCPGGGVPFTALHCVLCGMGVPDPRAAALFFRGFDANADGVVTFHELVRGLSAMTRGTNEERTRFAFRMHDADRGGFVSRRQLAENLEVLRAAFGPLQPYHAHHDTAPGGGVTAVEVADAAVSYSRGEGGQRDLLSYAAFVEYAATDESVIRGLALQS